MIADLEAEAIQLADDIATNLAATNAAIATKLTGSTTSAVTDAIIGNTTPTSGSVYGVVITLGKIAIAAIPDASITKEKIDYTSVDVYSASEVDTGKIWVDGRPIFRKVFRGQMTIVASNANTITHGIAFTNSMEIISLHGGVKLGASSVAGGQVQTLNYRESGGNWIHPTNVDLTLIRFTSSWAWGNSYYHVIMEYVK